jgi:hypothetical protein
MVAMSLYIELSTSNEEALRRRAARENKELSEVVAEILATNLAADGQSFGSRSSDQTNQEFAKWIDDWIAWHPASSTAIDCSRESIYGEEN